MKQIFTLFLFTTFVLTLKAQSLPSVTGSAQAYGKIDTADLSMKLCDFEKDANGEVLFDKANVYQDGNITVMERHKRVKIFNDFGKNEGNIRLEYVSYLEQTVITNLQAETINMEMEM